MKPKYEPRVEKRHRIFQAIKEMRDRGVNSITLEVICDELSYNEGEPSAKTKAGRQICHGVKGILMEMVKDGTLYLTNKVAYNIAGPRTGRQEQ